MEAHATNEAGDRYNYGCVFCTTGREDAVAGYITQQFGHIMALPAAQIKHKSANGKKSCERCIMLPGYIFLKTEASVLPIALTRTPGVLKVLCEEDRAWRLRNANRSFAAWVYENKGLIDMSKAYREGQTVRIVEGPLRSQQGNIVKIDKRNRNCLVSLSFNSNVIYAWLAFEYVD
jgi:transcription antitermination factor NusG